MNKYEVFLSRQKEIIKKAENLTCITRATILQEEIIIALDSVLKIIETQKQESIDNKNEDDANAFLSIQCALNALKANIKTFVLIKNGFPDQAWDSLISAQDYAVSAILAHPINAHLENEYCPHLEVLEKILFPPQNFMSISITTQEEICSICNKEYSECEHVSGIAYMGKFCQIIITKIKKINECSIVDNPADKKCRITHQHINGKRVNIISLLDEPD